MDKTKSTLASIMAGSIAGAAAQLPKAVFNNKCMAYCLLIEAVQQLRKDDTVGWAVLDLEDAQSKLYRELTPAEQLGVFSRDHNKGWMKELKKQKGTR